MSTTSATITFTAGTSDGSGVAWGSPGNVLASDDSRSTAALSSGSASSEVLHGSGFALGIPPEAEIKGIQASMEARFTGGGASVNVDSFRLEDTLAQVSGSDDKAGPTALTGSDATTTFGSSTDKWNANFHLAADLLARNFGVGMTALRATGSPQAEVDHISATIHYTVPGRGRGRSLRRWVYGHR